MFILLIFFLCFIMKGLYFLYHRINVKPKVDVEVGHTNYQVSQTLVASALTIFHCTIPLWKLDCPPLHCKSNTVSALIDRVKGTPEVKKGKEEAA